MLVARHLARVHGVRRLLLVSRHGPDAEGARELVAELEELGCATQVVACDVSDRGQVEGLILGVPEEHPLTMVIHAAGVLDDGVIEALDERRLAGVMAPKVDGAVHLHELTRGLGLCELVLFSSAAGVLGSPGQGNYAAANAFLDALAYRRRAGGLPAVSLAWGGWEEVSGMTAHLGEAGRGRLARAGMTAMSSELGLELFDRARGVGESLLLPVSLDGGALRALAKAGLLPEVLGSLVRSPVRRVLEGGGQLARRLGEAPESQWDVIVSELVREHAAGVLGHASGAEIDPGRSFRSWVLTRWGRWS